MKDELIYLSMALQRFTTALQDGVMSKDEYTDSDISSLYINVNAIKEQVVLITSVLDKR